MLSQWLKQACALLLAEPILWLAYLLFMVVVLALGIVSQALTIFFAVTTLFVGVGLAAYSDRAFRAAKKLSLAGVIRQTLPLAIMAALSLVAFWFSFRVIANLFSGEWHKIPQFFWQGLGGIPDWQNKPLRELSAVLYEIAIVSLIFTLLMLTSFASWFSFPLMTFNDYRWSLAKGVGNEASAKFRQAMTRLMYSSGLVIILGLGWLPFLTPMVYMFIAALMYTSYREAFVS